MASKPVPAPVSEVPQVELGSPYCSDPNCQSCKDLREAQEDVKAESGGGFPFGTQFSRETTFIRRRTSTSPHA
jgi:hypothetical protein